MNRKIIGVTVGTPLDPQKILEQAATANAIITKHTGETITTNDSANTPLQGMSVFGKSWQNTVGGNQLLKWINSEGLGGTVSADGLTATCNPQTTTTYANLFSLYHDAIPLVAGTTYYLSAKIKLVSGSLSLLNTISLIDKSSNNVSTKVEVSRPKISSEYQRYVYSFTPTADVEASRIYVQGYVADAAVCTITDIMISTVNTEWEPYVGGIASPNYEYKQDVHSHGDKGSIEYGVYGGNLADQTKAKVLGYATKAWKNNAINISYGISTYGRLVYIPFKGEKGKTYYYSFRIVKNVTDAKVSTYFEQIPQYFGTSKSSGVVSGKVTLNDNVTTVSLYVANTAWNENTEVLIDNFIFSEIDIPYEPYVEKQSLILQTPNGLGGLKVTKAEEATYIDKDRNMFACDYIDMKRYKRVQRIVEGVLDGSKVVGYTYGEYVVWHMTDNELFGHRVLHGDADNSKYYAMSDRFLVQSRDYMCTSYNKTRMCHMETTNAWSISTSLFETPDANGFKKFFSEHPTKVYAILVEPIETDLTEEEIAQYKALLMNYPNTTIINDAGAYTEIEQVSDTKIYVDNKFKELETNVTSAIAQLL